MEEILISDSDTGSNLPHYALQYFYDYLVHLATAFNELKNSLFDLMNDCPPQTGRHPKYLMLGQLVGEETTPCSKPSLYRHEYLQPPVYNNNLLRLREIKSQYRRLEIMAQEFYFLPF